MKHTETRYVWTQEILALGHIKLVTGASKDNFSDLHALILSNNEKPRLMQAMNQEFREGRALAAKRVLTGGLHSGNVEDWDEAETWWKRNCARDVTNDDRLDDRRGHFAKR